jgi:hypothetical protein
MNEQEAQKRVSAFRGLGYNTEQSFNTMEGEIFSIIKVMNGDTLIETITVPENAELLLQQIDKNIEGLESMLTEMQEKRGKLVEAMESI